MDHIFHHRQCHRLKWLGDLVGGITTAYIISSIGAIVGVIAGIKIARNLLD